MDIDWRPKLSDEDIRRLLDLFETAARVDGLSPVSERTILAIRSHGKLPGNHLIASEGDEIRGYLFADRLTEDISSELVVHPEHRRRGVGTATVRSLLSTDGLPSLSIWSHGDGPGAAGIARKFGFLSSRVLLQMKANVAEPCSLAGILPGTDVRCFDPTRDGDALLRLNSLAFATHPEQGGWSREDLEARVAEPWFDPSGVFLLLHENELIGFHWTKVHASVDGLSDERVGEVYVVGVRPGWHGRGAGKYLTRLGLNYFAQKNIRIAMLYVDESNAAAVRMYEGLGFETFVRHVMYRLTASESNSMEDPRTR